MCGTCGCSDTTVINIEEDILSTNNEYALKNSHFFNEKAILAINVMSSPGSGKTTLLSETMLALKDKMESAAIVGDQQTSLDAALLQKSGAQAVQVNTGKVCHLDAHMIEHALEKLPLKKNMTLFIENIGNLVCPVLFELGEQLKVVILSVTEGDNKPLKYPDMFRSADLMIITKIDLLPYVTFDVERCIKYAKQINPEIAVLQLSTTKQIGLSQWYDWILNRK